MKEGVSNDTLSFFICFPHTTLLYFILEPLILTLYNIQFIPINANNNKLHLLYYKICFRFALHSVYTIFALS